MNMQTNKRKSKLIVPAAIITLLAIAMVVVLIGNKKKITEKATAVPEAVNAIPVKVAKVEEKEMDNSLELTGFFCSKANIASCSRSTGLHHTIKY